MASRPGKMPTNRAPDLAPDLAGERGEGDDVVACVVEVGGGGRELRLERGHDLGVLRAHRGCVGLLEDGPHQGGHPRLRGPGDPGEQVAVVVGVMPTSA